MAAVKRLSFWMPLLGLIALLSVSLVACGGGDDDAGGNGADAALPTASDSGDGGDDNGPGDDAGNDDDSNGLNFGSGTAVVTVGDARYEFDLTAGSSVCRDVFDGLQLVGASDESRDITVDMWIPPTDWATYADERYDAPSIEVQDDTLNVDWLADPASVRNLAEGSSQVDSYDKDGLTAAGTATFVDTRALDRGESPASVQGTFQVSCDE
jgi:hypothetical protein